MIKAIQFLKTYRAGVGLVFALLFLLFMPSSESIWIDEGVLIKIAANETFSDMAHALVSESGSEAQMPLSAIYFWAWGKLAGFSEIALRFGNLIPLAFGLIVLDWLCRKANVKYASFLVAIAPVTWFYANEIRPYSLQVAGACGLAGVLVGILIEKQISSKCAFLFGLSAFVVAASSMLGIFCVGGVCAVLGILFICRKITLSFRASVVMTCWFFCLCALGAYYLYSLSSGSGGFRGRDVGIFNIAFAVYDSLGFYGLGPDRLAIRAASTGGASALVRLFFGFLPGLLILAFVWLGVIWAVGRLILRKNIESSDHRIITISLLSAPALGLLAFYLAASFIGFPFWGRHIVWAVPFLMTATAVTLESPSLFKRKLLGTLLLAALSIVLLFSSLRQRFLPAYSKDDYRSAASIARDILNRGKIVWWAAGTEAAEYYGLATEKAIVPDPVFVPQYPFPDLIVISKPDIYDRNGHIAGFAKSHGFILDATPCAFRVFRETNLSPVGQPLPKAK